jgi:hypothetical protein
MPDGSVMLERVQVWRRFRLAMTPSVAVGTSRSFSYFPPFFSLCFFIAQDCIVGSLYGSFGLFSVVIRHSTVLVEQKMVDNEVLDTVKGSQGAG